jgi:hypothetical protein
LDHILCRVIQDEDRTQSAKEWATLDAHLETFLTAVIKPLKHYREETTNIDMKRVKMFCE